jgi:hypothetical protein
MSIGSFGGRKRARAAALAVALGAVVAGGVVFAHVGAEGLAIVKRAEASVSVLMTLDELVVGSQRVVIGTPVDRTSRWEELPSGRRIVTYTKLSIDETLVGASNSEIVVRTFGGVVDGIGQQVSGEATLKIGERSLVFLADVEDGEKNAVTIVTGMAQGQFPLDESASEPVLKASADRGTLVKRRGPSVPAAVVLVGATLSTARSKIAESLDRMRGEK